MPDPRHLHDWPYCGTIPFKGSGGQVLVRITHGNATCDQVRSTINAYLNGNLRPQGTEHLATIGQWQCGQNPYAYAMATGRGGSCESNTATIAFTPP